MEQKQGKQEIQHTFRAQLSQEIWFWRFYT